MRRLVIAAAALVLALVGCSSAEPEGEQPLLDDYGLSGMDTREIVDHLDRLGGTDRPTDLMASVRVEELLMSDGETELELDIPDDLFYLAFAPYVDQTHECFYHSLTTCQGELTEQDVHVRIVDDATGEVLVDEQRTTFQNGFVGLWLPRDLQGTLEVTYEGLTTQVPFTTDEDGATCLTTDLQLT